MSLHDEISAKYFPFTDKCPQDSSVCIKEKCKYFINEKSCWGEAFEEMVGTIFNTKRYYHAYYDLRNEDKDWIGNISFNTRLAIEDKEDFTKPPQMFLEIGFNSQRLAEKVQKEFNLNNWELDPRCWDGGDDHDLIFTTNASYMERGEIEKMLLNIKDMLPRMVELERAVNTCQLCKRHKEALTEHVGHAICYKCEQKVIDESVESYFK